MQEHPFKIYVDRIIEDEVVSIDETVDAASIEIEERDLLLVDRVSVKGEAYLTSSDLVLSIGIKATVVLPCAICNNSFHFSIKIQNEVQVTPIETIQAIHDYRDEVRAAILLAIPSFAECHDGNCPHRKEINKYLTKDQGDRQTLDLSGLPPDFSPPYKK